MYKLVKLKKIASVSTGFPFKGNLYSDNGIRVVRGENVTVGSLRWDSIKCWNQEFDQLDKYSLKEADVVIGMDGSKVGKNRTRIKEEDLPLLLAQRVALLRNNELSTQNFLYYLIKATRFEDYVGKIQTGSSVPHISQKQIEEYTVPLIPVNIQKDISDVLIFLDSKIELNNKINAELESMAKLIYEYWFVQFDFPDKNGKPYKSSGGEMIYNKGIKNNIPFGWHVKSLNYFILRDKSGDWGKESAEGNYNTKVACIRGADINGINGKGEVKTPVRFILEKNEHKILAVNDLVIEISGGSPTQSTGRLACITAEVSERFENPLICSNFCKAVSLISEEAVFYFTHSWNRAYDNGVFFGFEGKTSGIKNLLFDSLVSHYQIPLPDKNLLEQFQEKISLFEKQKQSNLRQNQELAALRDWLLPMLMNGQLKVGTVPMTQNEILNKGAIVQA